MFPVVEISVVTMIAKRISCATYANKLRYTFILAHMLRCSIVKHAQLGVVLG